MINDWHTARHTGIVRICLGLYILSLMVSSWSSSTDLWSTDGMVPHGQFNLTYGIFPNVLNKFDSPLDVKVFLLAIIILSLLFIAGIARRWIALLLWYGWTCLLNRNNLIINPAIPYTGWLLLAFAIIPTGEGLSGKKKSSLENARTARSGCVGVVRPWLFCKWCR